MLYIGLYIFKFLVIGNLVQILPKVRLKFYETIRAKYDYNQPYSSLLTIINSAKSVAKSSRQHSAIYREGSGGTISTLRVSLLDYFWQFGLSLGQFYDSQGS